ncbi:MAG TPA: AGE family epimerase/isomerase, partial [Parafilimonas sp.]|nr:AGE family epimerase/isomerase [Parafilimonas sp.]
DADSEGVEGKYYTWGIEEVRALLGDESETFCDVFDVSETGNWEQTNILWMPEPLEKFSDGKMGDWSASLEGSKAKLFEARQQRIRPGLDDKIILGWNALMIKSLCKAYAATGEQQYRQLAEFNISFLEKNLQKNEEPFFYHSWNKKISSQEAFIDDYAALIQAYLFLQEVTGTTNYLLKAKAIAERVMTEFGDDDTVLFNFTNRTQTDNIIKKREIYDGATPSGNAVMAENLMKLSLLFDVSEWRNRALQMVGGIHDMAVKYPASFGFWCLNLQALVLGIEEIAILGGNYNQIAVEILAEYTPLKLLQSAANQTDEWPLLRGKPVNEHKTMIFVCENYQCQQPVETVEQFRDIISRKHF